MNHQNLQEFHIHYLVQLLHNQIISRSFIVSAKTDCSVIFTNKYVIRVLQVYYDKTMWSEWKRQNHSWK